MLNRRSLRIKAMQTIYAFLQCKQSDFHVAIDLIDEKLTPGFEVVERPAPEVIEENKKKANELFKEYYQKKPSDLLLEAQSEAREVATHAIDFYNKQVKKDFDYLAKNMVADLEKLESIYLLLLILPKELLKNAEQDLHNQENKYIKKNEIPFPTNLLNNSVIKLLNNNRTLQVETAKKNLSWAKEKDLINEWYLDILKKDEEFLKYAAIGKPSEDDDKKILNHLYKNIIFKLENFQPLFEDLGVRWDEDKEILKGMITKTLKSLSEENIDYQLELFTREDDWEEEKNFFEVLFKNTISRDKELEDVITAKTKNWDIERIALLDKIIIKMALTEMISFPGIPVKVTINEYLEISKRYSTPKSRQFINGLLDSISGEMITSGIIKKSGRGLIDNK
jgi:transcription antitermination protein NusB